VRCVLLEPVVDRAPVEAVPGQPFAQPVDVPDPIANRFQIVGVEVVPDIFDQFLDCQRDFVRAGHEGMRAAAVLWRRAALATDAARIDAFLLQPPGAPPRAPDVPIHRSNRIRRETVR